MKVGEMKELLFTTHPKMRIADHTARMIKEARKEAGLTQHELAKRMHTKQESIARAERGWHEISLSFLWRVGVATGRKLKLPEFNIQE